MVILIQNMSSPISFIVNMHLKYCTLYEIKGNLLNLSSERENQSEIYLPTKNHLEEASSIAKKYLFNAFRDARHTNVFKTKC